MRRKLVSFFCLFFLVSCSLFGQADTSYGGFLDKIFNLPNKSIHKLEGNYDKLTEKMAAKSEKWIAKMRKQEQKIQIKLKGKLDSVSFQRLQQNTEKFYTGIANRAKAKIPAGATAYIPAMDSLQAVSNWVKQLEAKMPKELTGKVEQFSQLSASLGNAQQQISAYTHIRKLLQDRKQQLLQQYQRFGLSKELTAFKKQCYYYQQQLEEYKALFRDEEKLTKRLLAYAKELPAFQDFFRKNSQLAQIFNIPGIGASGGATAQALPGLQTVSSVQQQMTQSLGANINPQQLITQQISAAQSQLSVFKEKVNQLGGGSDELEMPEGFKPNQQRTKSLLKRLEFGVDIQSKRTRSILPATTDIAVSTGFKINDKSTIGIAGVWSMGWGQDFRNIQITHQGVGWRSFVDIKIKGNWWITGGYEENYKAAFRSIEALKDRTHWQQSGLIGLTKKYKIGKKTGKLQLLWDMLSYRQIPPGQALQFRTGLNFK